jgi:phosphate transport system permease protein
MLSSEQAQEQPLASLSPAPARKRSVGESWVWLCSGALSLTLLALLGLVLLIFSQGFKALWPKAVEEIALKDGSRLLGEIIEMDDERGRLHLKRGNRDLYGLDFTWLETETVLSRDRPKQVYLLERQENGVFFGFLAPEMGGQQFNQLLEQAGKERERVNSLEKDLNDWNHRLARLDRDLAKSGEEPQKGAYLL